MAEVLNEFGTLHRVRGDLVQAGACHQKALDLAREDGIRWDEAHALASLGRCALAADRIADAEDQLRRALEIFQQIGTTEAAHVAAELDALPLLPSGSPGAGRVWPLTPTTPTSSPLLSAPAWPRW
jgi:Tfp pilus assembly protein PilF